MQDVGHLLVATHNQDLAASKGGQSDTNTVPVQLTHRSHIFGSRVNDSNCLSSGRQEVTIQIDYVSCIATSQGVGHIHSCSTYVHVPHTCMYKCTTVGMHSQKYMCALQHTGRQPGVQNQALAVKTSAKLNRRTFMSHSSVAMCALYNPEMHSILYLSHKDKKRTSNNQTTAIRQQNVATSFGLFLQVEGCESVAAHIVDGNSLALCSISHLRITAHVTHMHAGA